jgi:hypothetical protein
MCHFYYFNFAVFKIYTIYIICNKKKFIKEFIIRKKKKIFSFYYFVYFLGQMRDSNR